METFVRLSGYAGLDASLLEVAWSLREAYVCAHRGGRCRVQGLCVFQDMETIVALVEARHDRQMARDVASRLVEKAANPRETYCAAVNFANRGGFGNNDAQIRQAAMDLELITMDLDLTATFSDLTPERRDGGSCYLDDSQSYIHLLFTPLLQTGYPNAVAGMKVGRYLFLSYEMDALSDVTWQHDPDVLAHTNHFLAWGATDEPYVTPYIRETLVRWLVWVPSDAWELIQDEATLVRMYRVLESDTKMLRLLTTGMGPRIFYQRFGVEGSGLFDVEDVLRTSCGGRDFLLRQIERTVTHPHHLQLPMLMLRGLRHSLYRVEEVEGWLTSDETCQLCAIAGFEHPRAIIQDTRASEFGIGVSQRSVRPICHFAGSVPLPMLQRGEAPTLQGEHWCAVNALDGFDSVYITASSAHRLLRALGIRGAGARRMMLQYISYSTLHFSHTPVSIFALYRLTMYAYFRLLVDGEPLDANWTDLGVFLKFIMAEPVSSALYHRRIHSAMTRISLAQISMDVAADRIQPPAWR
uniref:Non-structural protein NS1 n=1 Tax=Fomede virus TaxID=2547356 RepID=A0A482A5K4_9REOV|nr:NS1 [Fomede virus]